MLLAISLAAGRANEVVVNFDDLAAGSTVPTSYRGFNWSPDWSVEDNGDYNSWYRNSVAFPSDPNAVWNTFGVVAISLSGGAHFNFIGADFTGWAEWNHAMWFTAPSITVYGYNGATLVGSATMSLPTADFGHLNANLDDVTSLVFNNGGSFGQWWLMDNFTYNVGSVPDGGTTFSLLSMGLAGLAALRHCKRKA